MGCVAENAMQGQRKMLMSEALAELQNRDGTIRQLKVSIEEDQRVHADEFDFTSRSS